MNHTIIPPYPNPNSNFPSDSNSQMLNLSEYSSNFTYQVAYQPYTINPNNDPVSSFSQPAVPSAEASTPALHPPVAVTESYANFDPYLGTHIGFQGQTPFFDDPNAVLPKWVVKKAERIRNEALNKFLDAKLSVPAREYWRNRRSANNAIKKVVQPMRCDVCNIDCTSKENYGTHILGKKHQKKIRIMQNNPAAAGFPGTSHAINSISLPSQTNSVGGQVIFGNSDVAAGVEMETKRRKILNGDAAIDSVRVCSICNVACNSEEVFNTHLAGKRHKAQASSVALVAVPSQYNGIWKKEPNQIKLVQSSWCEVCKINCNSNDTYIKHLAGKKHQKNLEQLGRLKNDGSASTSNVSSATENAIIGPMENPGAKSLKGSQPQAPQEDLETKKRNIMTEGAAASAVRTCTVCNVVCNSETVFSSHLTGQKHTSMVKKLAEAGIAIQGP